MITPQGTSKGTLHPSPEVRLTRVGFLGKRGLIPQERFLSLGLLQKLQMLQMLLCNIALLHQFCIPNRFPLSYLRSPN